MSTLAQQVKPDGQTPLQIGNPNAEFKIEVYNDYQCPACSVFNQKLKRIREKHSDRIHITFRNFFLPDIHKIALNAAKAVEAAAKQSKFPEMLDLVYQNQDEWSENENPYLFFEKFAQILGLDVELFKQDFQSKELLDRISSDMERSISLKINAVPTVFLNGKRISFSDAGNLEEIISKGIR